VNGLAELTEFAKRYAKAWCSQNPESVAAFFAENGSISINNGPPAVGRAAIAEEAQAFMTTFPDMVVTMDKVVHDEEGTKFHWTLTGTNTDPAALEIKFGSAATNFGRLRMTASSQNRKATSTARSTNVSSSTERNLDGTRESGLHLRHEIKDSVSHSGTLFRNGDGLFGRERTDGDMEAERQKIEARQDGKK
jgi:SnoaL-like domain